jgi:hypothetical protein
VLSLRQNSEVPRAIDVIQTDNFVMMTMSNRDTAPVAAGRLWGSNFNLNMLWTGNITWNSFTRPWLRYCRAHWTWGTLTEIFECNSANALALFAFVFLVSQVTTSTLGGWKINEEKGKLKGDYIWFGHKTDKGKVGAHLVESLKVMRLAEQESQIRRLTFIEVGQINLTVAIFAFSAMLMKYGPIKIYLGIHYVYCLGAYLTDWTTHEEKNKMNFDSDMKRAIIVVRFRVYWGDKGW